MIMFCCLLHCLSEWFFIYPTQNFMKLILSSELFFPGFMRVLFLVIFYLALFIIVFSLLIFS